MKTQRITALVSSAAALFFLLAMTFQVVASVGLPSSLGVGDNTPVLASPSNQTIISCPVVGSGGDGIQRGFYVENYPGTNLGTVQLTYWTDVAGTYTISMTARSGTYDGPIIGTQMVTVSLPASTNVTATFDFGGVPVITGTIVTFSQVKASGPGWVYYNTGPCGFDLSCTACPGIIQTDGTTPPLDTPRRISVGVTITQYWRLYLPLVIK